MIDKKELKYIIIAGIFSFIYFIYILPFFIKKGAEAMSPTQQFILFSIGIYFIYFLLFKSFALSTKKSLLMGLVFGVLPFMAMDIIQPEYHINLINGTLDKGATLGMASADYVIGSWWESIGIKGYLLVPLVYFVAFTILLIIIALLKKNFVKEL